MRRWLAQQGPTVCVHTQPLSFGQWAEKYRTGESLVVTDVMQVPERVLAGGAEVPEPDALLSGGRKAREIEPGRGRWLLDERGFVTEASTANVARVFCG